MKLYKRTNVSHLSIQEVEFELHIRDILFDFSEHESVKRRRLKDRLQDEKENAREVSFSKPWREMVEELEIVMKNLTSITSFLEKGPKTQTAIMKPKLQTRLIHYIHRIELFKKLPEGNNYKNEIAALEKGLKCIHTRYYTLLSDLPEVRREVQQKIAERLARIKKDQPNESIAADGLVTTDSSEKSESEADSSQKNSSEQENPEDKPLDSDSSTNSSSHDNETEGNDIINKINEIVQNPDPGKVDNEGVKLLLGLFKDFVIDSRKKQQNLEKEIKEQFIRERQAYEEERKRKELSDKLSEFNKTVNRKLKSKQSNKNGDKNHKKVEPIPKPEREKKLTPKTTTLSSVSEVSSSEEEIAKLLRKRTKKTSKKKRSKSSSTSADTSDSSTESSEVSSYSTSSLSSSSTSSRSNSSRDSDSRRKRSRKRRSSKRSRRKSKKSRHRHGFKRLAVADWKIRYDGKDNGRKLVEFLKEVKMRSGAEKVDQKELFRSAIHLFSGRAKDWLIEGLENKEFHNWRGLKRALKREFLPPDIDYQLEVQAAARKQQRGEKFSDYYHDIQKMFQSMQTQLSSKRKLEIVWRNMRHDYKNALTSAKIRKLTVLKKYGMLIDENNCYLFQKNQENVGRPRSNQVSELTSNQKPFRKQFQNNSYNNHPSNNNFNKTNSRTFENSKFKSNSSNNNKPSTSEPNKVQKPAEKPTELEPMPGSAMGTLLALADKYQRPPFGTCFNCKKTGHHFGDCPEKRYKFCKQCGFSDVETLSCPVCIKNASEST